MARITRKSAFAGMTAALAMTITPIAASAAELPSAPVSKAQPAPFSAPMTFEPAGETASHHRGWRGYRGYRGWRGYRGYRGHRRGIDAGDVLAGVVILGGIAAIASAANKNKRERDYRDRDYRYRDSDYRDRDYDRRERRRDSRYNGRSGIDNAVRMCVDEIERDVRVESVDGVDRTGSGWRVSGSLYNGDGFTCQIDPEGRISTVDYGRTASNVSYSDDLSNLRTQSETVADGQWSADRYAQARRTTDTSSPAARTIDARELRPAYPGGPLPGEAIASESPASTDADDRYRTAEAPDFTG